MAERVVVAQLGARMHYAVPRILHATGELHRLYTDICATRGWPRGIRYIPAAMLPAAVRRLRGRIPEGIPTERITTFPTFGLQLAARRMRARTPSQHTETAIWGASRFGSLVNQAGFAGATGFYGFSGDCLEQIAAAREAGLWTTVEQIIAPRGVLDTLMEEEESTFPEWRFEQEHDRFAHAFAQRERAEWDLADLVVCGSEFVRRGVTETTGGRVRCVVVPYGVDRRFALPARNPRKGPLRVLTVGAADLRKGTPYVLAAARQLAGKATFRLVGFCNVPEQVRRTLADTLELTGVVPRAEILKHYEWADVFLLPSLCEGSATVVYEALAAGLPVVTTENTGTVVRDGEEGFIVPIRDPDAIVTALERLDDDRDMLAEMSHRASRRAAAFDLQHYGARLRQALAEARDVHRHAGSPERHARSAASDRAAIHQRSLSKSA